METIGVIGVGKLGVCIALALEDAGYNLVCYEKNAELSLAITNKSLNTIEPSVGEFLKKSTNITMSSLESVYSLPTIFVVVATPSLPNGSYNHSAVDEVIDNLLELNNDKPDYSEKLLVISCTTMPMYCDTVQARLGVYNYKVCYNPEFIVQGDILKGLKNPDMVLIGHSDEESSKKLIAIYNRFLENSPVVQTMSRTEAEITKIALNCFLTTKIAFANMIGDIVLKADCNQNVVLNAIGADTRVGRKFLKWGHGFGGPCLPRDNRALCYFSNSLNIAHTIGETTDKSNQTHLKYLLEYIMRMNVDNKPIYFDSIVYKNGTHIIEESQRLELAKLCVESGLVVQIYDNKKVLDELVKIYGDKFTYIYELTGNESALFDVNSYIP